MSRKIVGLVLASVVSLAVTLPALAVIDNDTLKIQLENTMLNNRTTLRAQLENTMLNNRNTLRTQLEATMLNNRNTLRAQLENTMLNNRNTLRAQLENTMLNNRNTLRAQLEAKIMAEHTQTRTEILDALGDQDREAIEYALKMKKRLAIYFLPNAFGGKLQEVAAIVQDTINKVNASPESSFNAQLFYNQAVPLGGGGQYKAAFDKLCIAYCMATSTAGEWPSCAF